ncbi:MAG: transposase [Candidatus Andersenbacteria bacterium]|nr:transposase [Candidatus Andersenbacteria bacterium]
MPTNKRQFSPSFKAKVALELIQGHETIAQICSKYQPHPTQARKWKEQAITGLEVSFSDSRAEALKAKDTINDELYRQIGKQEGKGVRYF